MNYITNILFVTIALATLWSCRSDKNIGLGNSPLNSSEAKIDTLLDDVPEATVIERISPTEIDYKSTEYNYDSIVYKEERKSIMYKQVIVFPVNKIQNTTPHDFRKVIVEMIDSAFKASDVDNLRKFLKRQAQEFFNENEVDLELSITLPEHDARIGVVCETDNYITFINEGYEHYGGAHGIPWRGFFTVDLSTGKVMEWDDIIKPDKKEEATRIVWNAIIKQYYSGNDETLYSDAILPGAPAALSDKGIIFVYSVYEIGPFSDGMPECVVGVEELRDCLTDKAKLLLAGR